MYGVRLDSGSTRKEESMNEPRSARFTKEPVAQQVANLESALKELKTQQPESGQHQRFIVRMLCLLQKLPYPGLYALPNSTPMQTFDIPVERIPMPERAPSEPDLAHKWATSMQPRFEGLVAVRDEIVRNHQTVLFCESANKDIRLRAKHQLERIALDGNDEATAVLRQWQECGLSLE